MTTFARMKKTANTDSKHSRMPRRGFRERCVRDFKKNRVLYLLVLPVLAFYIIFHYMPMYGVTIAFKNFSPSKGIMESPWIGMEHFTNFFGSVYFKRVLLNTLRISFTSILFGFTAPIILALLINELRSKRYARIVQTVTYMPHFISLVVVCGILTNFLSETGVITQFYLCLEWKSKIFCVYLDTSRLFISRREYGRRLAGDLSFILRRWQALTRLFTRRPALTAPGDGGRFGQWTFPVFCLPLLRFWYFVWGRL